MKSSPIHFVIVDASNDIHAIASSEAKAKEWIAKSERKHYGRIVFTIHQVEFVG